MGVSMGTALGVPQSAIAAAGPSATGPRIPQVVSSEPAGDRPAAASPVPNVRCDLLELLAAVSDGRPGQGRAWHVSRTVPLATLGVNTRSATLAMTACQLSAAVAGRGR